MHAKPTSDRVRHGSSHRVRHGSPATDRLHGATRSDRLATGNAVAHLPAPAPAHALGRSAVHATLAASTVALTLAVAPALATAQDFTLEQVLSAPFPSGLVAAPAGGAVAWVENAEGERNVWIAEAPDWRGRRLTDYAGDDGREIGSLAFTHDGAALLYVRGGNANPNSDPAGAARETWIVPTAGGEPRRLEDVGGYTLSPVANVLAYTRSGAIWTLDLDDPDAEGRRLAVVRDGAGSLRWAPDATKLAFVSSRGDHAFVGVFDLEAGTLRWLDPSLDRDGRPAWSPDGTRIAFTRIPNDRDRLPFTPVREARPWSIRVADVATGESREIWRADPGPGSAFYGITADNQIFWGRGEDGDVIVFPWEKDGRLRLWAVPVAGGPAKLLTPGGCTATWVRCGGEVQYAALEPDGRGIVYASNHGDVDRKHLWRVRVDGGPPEPLTRGDGIEWAPVAVADGAVAYLASGARTPAHARILAGGESRALVPDGIPADFPADALVEPRQVVFAAADGVPIHGQLFLPAGLDAGERRPAVVFFHGGSRRQMLLGFHSRGYYHNAYAMNQYLASRGYIVLSVNYRSGIGYGMEFREAENYGAAGASEFNDVIGAGLYLRSRDDVDPDRIGLWGGSYGGYMTAFGLARASDLFAAGVDFHGAHDWNVVIRNFRPDYRPEARPAFAERAYRSSPIAYVDTWRSPVLLIHADDDRNVPFSESVDLAEELRVRGVEVESLVFPDDVHGFLLHRNWLAAYRATAAFFDRRLGPPRAARVDGR